MSIKVITNNLFLKLVLLFKSYYITFQFQFQAIAILLILVIPLLIIMINKKLLMTILITIKLSKANLLINKP